MFCVLTVLPQGKIPWFHYSFAMKGTTGVPIYIVNKNSTWDHNRNVYFYFYLEKWSSWSDLQWLLYYSWNLMENWKTKTLKNISDGIRACTSVLMFKINQHPCGFVKPSLSFLPLVYFLLFANQYQVIPNLKTISALTASWCLNI